MGWCRTMGPWAGQQKPEISPRIHGQRISDRAPRTHYGEKAGSSVDGGGRRKREPPPRPPPSNPTPQTDSTRIRHWKVRPDTATLLEANREKGPWCWSRTSSWIPLRKHGNTDAIEEQDHVAGPWRPPVGGTGNLQTLYLRGSSIQRTQGTHATR